MRLDSLETRRKSKRRAETSNLDANPGLAHGAAAAEKTSEAASKSPTALLVWADEIGARHGAECLKREGFAVTATASGAQALTLYHQLDPAVVLLDATLPDTTGAGLCADLRCAPGGLQVPVLVAYSGEQELALALEAGATEVVHKPVDWHLATRRATLVAWAFRAEDELGRVQERLAKAEKAVTDAHVQVVQLAHQTTVDRLTGLPKRGKFIRLLSHALATSRGQRSSDPCEPAEDGDSGEPRQKGGLDDKGRQRGLGPMGAVLYLDLDRFQEINRILERQGGDEVLCQVAERLGRCLRRCLRQTESARRSRPAGHIAATVARLGQDEFSLMLTGIAREEVSCCAERILGVFSHPFTVNGTEVFVSASLGIALFADDVNAEQSLQNAETAVREVKRRGGGAYRFFCQSLNRGTQRRLQLYRTLHRALERRQLALHYQPIVDTMSRRHVGVEALLRWHHPELGWVPPAEFIAVAEETGLMVGIGTWVLRTACQQLRSWLDGGMSPIRMAVNVSTRQVERGNLAVEVQAALRESRLEPDLLELELSERGVLRNDPEVCHQLEELKGLGVRLSVDDFGTGHAAIPYLRRFPLDTLKIDALLVRGILERQEDAAITSTIIEMAHHLRLNVIAEGVEAQSQLDFLSRHGCERLQGFLFSPPVTADELRPLLNHHARGDNLPLRCRRGQIKDRFPMDE